MPQESRFLPARIPAKAKKLSLGYWHLDAFNRDTSIKPARYEAAMNAKADKLRQWADAAKLPEPRIQSIISNILPFFVHADELAIHYERRHVTASKAIFILSALAVTIAVFQTLFLPHRVWILDFEVAAMLALLLFFALNRWCAWHERWLHDRHFAEQMRTATFALALERGPGNAACGTTQDAFLLCRATQLAAHGHPAGHRQRPAAEDHGGRARAGETVSHQGLAERAAQLSFGQRPKEEKAAHKVHWSVVILMAATLAMALLHLFGVGHGHSEAPFLLPGVWITFLAIVLPAWGAAIHGIGKQLEYERIAARSEKMAEVISLAIENVDDADTVEELERVVEDVARLMGLENYEWWVLLSFDKAVPVV